VIERGECDLVTDLAGEMPSYLIADLMGLPLDDGRELYKLTEILHSSGDVVTTEQRRQAQTDMFTYAAEVYGKKSIEPGEDLSTRIINAEVDGEQLDMIDFALFFMLLVDAGGDTTRNLVSGGMLELLRAPEQLEALRADPDALLGNAVEEMLRFVSPVIYMRRTATQSVTLGGKNINAGDKVVMYYGAANRDPAVFDDPDRFDIMKANAGDHLAFGGGGPHFCLGANLARLEIDALLRHLAELINHLTTEPRCFVSDEGRAFIEADGSLRAPNRKSLWPPLIFATGIALFGAFLFMNNTDVDMSGRLADDRAGRTRCHARRGWSSRTAQVPAQGRRVGGPRRLHIAEDGGERNNQGRRPAAAEGPRRPWHLRRCVVRHGPRRRPCLVTVSVFWRDPARRTHSCWDRSRRKDWV